MLDDFFLYLRKKEGILGKDGIDKNPVLNRVLKQKATVIIYGAGALGHVVYDTLVSNSITPQFFCSGLKSNYVDSLTGKRVISKEALAQYSNSVVIFAIGDTASKEEKEQLKKDVISMGYSQNQILNHAVFEEKISPSFLIEHEQEITEVYNFLSDNESRKVYLQKLAYMVEYIPVEFESNNTMYVDSDIVNFYDHEIVIDAGAYNGDTALLFRRIVGKNADIYSFEPDFSNYSDLKRRVQDDSNIYPENLGLWNSKGMLCFSDDRNGSSHVERDGTIKVEVTDLDSYCREKEIVPTFIKMDIEGAEIEAILGARKSIEKGKPKLAICLYHRPEDIFKIPLLVHRINSSYKMYIRHYSNYYTDTLLYAM